MNPDTLIWDMGILNTRLNSCFSTNILLSTYYVLGTVQAAVTTLVNKRDAVSTLRKNIISCTQVIKMNS